ncbi:MAG: aryl-sulfate sulfotransferase, partial [Planctomycetota bacterium]
ALLELILVALAAGCRPYGPPPRFTKAPIVEANPNRRCPLAAVLRFEADRAVNTAVAVSDGERAWELRFGADRRPADGLPVVGMRPGRDHTIRVTISDPRTLALAVSKELTFTTPPLPEGAAEFPVIQATPHLRAKMEPGLTLLNPRRRLPQKVMSRERTTASAFGRDFGLLVIVNAAGEVVWYCRTDARISDLNYLPNGHILYGTTDQRIIEIDLLGNVVASWYAAGRPDGEARGTPVQAMTLHHDVDRLPDGHILALDTQRRRIENYYTSDLDPDAPRKPQWVMGDRVIEFDPSGRVLWSWSAFDHLDPMRIGYETFSNYWVRRGFPDTLDWSHANGVQDLPEDDAVLVNFRYQSCVVKVDRATGAIRWIFGEPSGWPKRLEGKLLKLTKGTWPWHQHSPVLTERGTLLLFDNGNFRARPFDDPVPIPQTHSRAVEYRIDERAMTAEQIWSSNIPGEPQVVSFAMGSVQPLPRTGNVLAGYGMILPTDKLDTLTWETRARYGSWTRIREYTRSSPAKVVWELTVTGKAGSEVGWTLFGCQRIPGFLPFQPQRRR